MLERSLFRIVVLLAMASGPASAQDRDTLVRQDRDRYGQGGPWIYDDLDQGLALAKREGKPLLVVFRCIPCEACKKFDEDVARRTPEVADLMDRFVGVRLVQANRIDLTRFRHDFDQSFAVYFLGTDGGILGRYGTRSGRAEASDMELDGFRAAMTRALEIHEAGAGVRESLAGKQVAPDEFRTPEDFPSVEGRFPDTLDYAANVAKSCLHCHQVAEAFRRTYRQREGTIPDRVLFPYPDPTVIGLTMSPRETARVLAVEPGSSAEQDGIRGGDLIVSVEGQPLVSVADLQWILDQADDPAVLVAEVERDGKKLPLSITLNEGFRRRGDLSWRASAWDLRRMGLGGMRLSKMLRAERQQAGLPEDKLALKVAHVGQYGEHAVAKAAGVLAGDILVSFDGHDEPWSETDLMAYAVQRRKPGDEVEIELRRQGETVRTRIRLQ